MKDYDNYKLHSLKNNLEYITVNIPDSTEFCIYILINTGSIHENRAHKGISHLLEHMLYRTNDTFRKDNELYDAIYENGADYNGFTDKTETGYYFTVYHEKYKNILEILGNMIYKSRLESKYIDMEREIIMGEIKRDNDSPFNILYEFMDENRFSIENPYRNPIAGNKDTLDTIDKKILMEYYKKNYRSDNMKCVIVGKIPQSIHKDMEKYLGYTNKRKDIDCSCTKIAVNTIDKNKNIFYKYMDTEQVYISLSFLIFGRDHIQKNMIHLVYMYLDNRLKKVIREKHGLSYHISCDYVLYSDFGLFDINVDVDKKNVKKTIKLILEILDKIKKTYIKKKTLDTIKEHIKNTTLIEYNSTMNIAHLYAYELLHKNNHDRIHTPSKYIEINENITLQHVKDLANILFDLKTLHICILGKNTKKLLISL
jgi:predicted Zn-dependent peptidase